MAPHDVTALDDLLVLNTATSQRDRLAGAPAPDRVRVDGRTLADLLSFAADYGALIRFYDLADTEDGDWSAFFLIDESIRLALRAGLDLADIETEFDRLLQRMRAAADLETRLKEVELATRVLLRLIRILGEARAAPFGLVDALTSLSDAPRAGLTAGPARALAMHIGRGSPEDRLRREMSGLSDSWFRQFVDFLADLITALVTALEQGRAEAAAEIEASYHTGTHPPQSGMYDAFAKLFGHAQNTINRFPAKLLEFYSAEVLRQLRRGGEPDSLWLTFTPDKGVDRVDLPKGAAFAAGADASGQTIAYALEDALRVSAAAIASLSMVTATSAPPAPGAGPAPAQVFSSVVALAETPPAIASPAPIFGGVAVGVDGVTTTTLASLGFAIASPTLLLGGGKRTITLGLTLTEASLARVTPTLEAIAAAAGLEPSDVLARLLHAGLSFSYSTPGSWVPVIDFDVAAPSEPGGLDYTLTIRLDPDAPPLAPFGAPPPGVVVPDPDSPTLMAALVQALATLGKGDQTVEVYPYAVLADLALAELSLSAAVEKLADLVVSTDAGLVDISQPFPTFGSPPVQHATLNVWTAELFVKPVTSLSLSMDWSGLPVTTTGFLGYYQAYVVDADGVTHAQGELFDNASFTVTLDVAAPGAWKISGGTQYLFAAKDGTKDPDGAPANTTIAPNTTLTGVVAKATPPDYYDPASSALRVTLDTPDYAFGNILYAPNVMAASLQLTAAASACAQRCGQGRVGAFTQLIDPVIAANATAGDAGLAEAVKTATGLAVASLDGAALQAIEDALAAATADEAVRKAWRASLDAALASAKTDGLPQFLARLGRGPADGSSVHGNLLAWLPAWRAGNAQALTPAATQAADTAQALLDAGTGLTRVQADAEGKPPSVARVQAAAGFGEVQARLGAATGEDCEGCIERCLADNPVTFPNQPWLPQTAKISVDYGAATGLPPAPDAPSDMPPGATWYLLAPFETVTALDWATGGEAPLLPPVIAAGTLDIGLSQAVSDDLTLLFRLSAPRSGWPTDTPGVVWESIDAAGKSTTLTVLRDTTNALRNSGIVSLALSEASPDAALTLRVSTPYAAAAYPDLSELVTNAGAARWTGPGGADDLGTPLQPHSITRSLTPIAGLGSVDQPAPSTGGRSALVGPPFHLWLAERLRHKDYGIQAWDYARLALAAYPSLWQMGVIPASAGGATPAPGHVWLVPVPGPTTANVTDPTIPSNDSALLQDIADYLAARISPFIQLTVTNPPYLRLSVDADVIFSDADTVQACLARLNDELIAWLSPWPAPDLGPRPDDYYTRRQVAHFIRNRPYVKGIRSIWLIPESPERVTGWRYLTSALDHRFLRGSAATIEPPLNQARLRLGGPAEAQS